jgi:hypothetical protein
MKISEKSFFLILFSLIFFLAFITCETNKTPLNTSLQPQVILSLDREPYPKEIKLKLQLKNVKLPVQYQITRDNNQILSGPLAASDTIFKDSGLHPAKQYNYQAFIYKDASIDAASNILKATTMDTTTHNYIWTVDTIGLYGSRLFDVFAISEDNIWAVGQIEMGENEPYNAVHWNGQQWELKRVYFYSCPNGTIPIPFHIQAIFALSDNDIWFTRGGSFVYWDGNQFIHNCSMNTIIDGSIYKIWRGNSENSFAVGYNGTIISHDGIEWSKMTSGTQIKLSDIWGLSENDIYAVGADMSTLDNVVLHYDGASWSHLPTDQNRKVGVWGTAPDHLFFTGDGVRTYDGEDYHLIDWPSDIPYIFSHSIRGTAINNIAVAGEFGLVLHFNGSDWKGYPQLLDFSATALKAVSVTNNSIFAVGLSNYQGIVYHGKRID